ncbi:CvpA family protein [Piscinibacter sp.]|jgi:membrane protein required for colicin V production|uniref:CvpA family protein n=1 Tax=Piscinibacter sp. TaxID=1903157 RepID=UPI00355A6D8C
MHDIAWVDAAFLAILVLSVIVGLWRGLLFELLSLIGWVVAYLAANGFAAAVAPHIPVGRLGSPLNHAVAFTCIFVAVLIVWGLAARLLRLLIHATPLSPIDRVLGATFGLARGMVVMLAITTVVMLTSMAKSNAWQQSRAALWLNGALHELRPVLPAQIAEHLPR